MAEKLPRSHRYSRRVAILWTLFILALLTIPGSALPVSDLWKLDKLVHAGLFMVLALLWQWDLDVHGKNTWILIVFGVSFGILTEIYQEVLPFGRLGEPLDALADVVGFVLGTLCWFGLRRRLRKDTSN